MTTKKCSKPCPSSTKKNGQDISMTDNRNGADNKIVLSEFINFESWFENINGIELVNIKRLAEAFGKTEKDCIEILTNFPELFKGAHFEFSGIIPQKSKINPNQKRSRGRPQKEHYLTRDGCLAFVNRLDYNRYDFDISQFIIEFQKWLILTAGKVIDLKMSAINSGYTNIDPGQLESDYKSRSITNIARTRMLRYQLSRQKPYGPDTVNRTNAMYRHDYESMFGPISGNLPRDWRKKSLNEQAERTIHLKELMEFGEFMQGNINQDSVNIKVLNCFKEVFPEYIPPHLISLIEPTKQTKLLMVGDEA